ncbi:MAG: hypothetical protein SFU98_05350 [Leptospiraceae bacterium]|nr:hypothetical protein [Leptospiraceae bacterium]
MLRKLSIPILIILILILFFFSSRSIASVKIQELRFYLAKEQLLNYELSSKVLKEKIKQMLISKDDFTNEIKNNIIESNIMNSETGMINPKLSLMDSYGLLLVNLVRVLTLKNWLTLVEDQNDMVQVQYAFFMERTRKYSTAVKKYENLEKRFGKIDSNENGFVRLHHGFSLAMMGEIDKAINKLKETEEIFAGTHFADNARILINVLLEGIRKTEEIKNKNITSEEKANLFFDSGKYKETLEALNKVENRTAGQNYMRARSLEEVGNTSEAVTEYVKLVSGTDTNAAKSANRRLLLIGNIYEKNKELADFSKKNAEKLGDTEVIKQVEDGSKLITQSVVIEKIKSGKIDDTPGLDKNEIATIKEEYQKLEVEVKKEQEKLKNDNPSIVATEEPKPEEIIENINLIFYFNDGRVLTGSVGVFKDEKIIISSGGFSVSVPEILIKTIEMERTPKNPNTRIVLTAKNDKNYRGWKIERDDDDYFLTDDKRDRVQFEQIKKVFVR